MSHCIKCEEEDNLIPCNVCMGWLCRKHRVGTGSVRDGYTCIEHMLGPTPTKLARPKNKYEALADLIVLAIFVIAALVIYGAFEFCRTLWPLIEVTHH
jgi:hypothetical protein